MPRLTLPPKKKKSSKTPALPVTAEDFLELGVELEGDGEKWRAGDAAKSARFFVRAVQNYDAGLAKFPSSFDLAYNKARLQYSITQYPLLRAQFPNEPTALLQEALASHRRAAIIEPSNTDVIFNTAQVLSSLVGAIDDAGINSTEFNPSALLEEAIALFQKCLAQQQLEYEQGLAQDAEYSAEDDGGVSLNGDGQGSNMSTQATEEEQWAAIIEPVTMQSLLHTPCALLDTLAQACSLLAPSNPNSMDTLESIAQPLIKDKILVYMQNVEAASQREAWLMIAQYTVSQLEASYRSGRFGAPDYEKGLTDTFELIEGGPPDLLSSAGFLVSYADALVAFNGALAERQAEPGMRWKALVKTLEVLLAAAKAPDVEMLPRVHVFRGDVELLRLMVTSSPGLPDSLTNDKVKQTLLNNAETYYRGAVTVSQSSISWSQSPILAQAKIKRAIVDELRGKGTESLRQIMQQGIAKQTVVDVVNDMAAESLITDQQRQRILGS